MPVTTGIILAGIGAAGKIYDAYEANQRSKKAQSALDELSKEQYSKYTVNPESKKYLSLAQQGIYSPQGLTGGEKAAYHSDVAGNINTINHNATATSGGNLSKYIISALNPAVVSASNSLAVTDAELKRANQRDAYGRYGIAVNNNQNIDNLNTTAELNRRQQKENALGNAVLQNNAFETNSIESGSSDLISGGLSVGLGGSGNGTNKALALQRTRNQGLYLGGSDNPYSDIA